MKKESTLKLVRIINDVAMALSDLAEITEEAINDQDMATIKVCGSGKIDLHAEEVPCNLTVDSTDGLDFTIHGKQAGNPESVAAFIDAALPQIMKHPSIKELLNPAAEVAPAAVTTKKKPVTKRLTKADLSSMTLTELRGLIAKGRKTVAGVNLASYLKRRKPERSK